MRRNSEHTENSGIISAHTAKTQDILILSKYPPIPYTSILTSNEINPNKINYYLVRKDPDFESKIHDVLVIYKQIEMCFDD